jgi:hypothetical protein
MCSLRPPTSTSGVTADLWTTVRASWSLVHENLTQNETQAGSNSAGVRDFYDPALNGSFSTVFVTPSYRADKESVH